MSQTLLAVYSAPNKDSNSASLLDEFCKGAKAEDVEVFKVYLYDLNIPYFNYGNRRADPPDDPDNRDVKKMEELIMGCHGIVFATPVWNFSVPAVLKNLLDRISYFGRVSKSTHLIKKKANLGHVHCYYIFTTGAPWWGWPIDSLAYFSTKFTMKYFGARNEGLLRASNCGLDDRHIKHRPKMLKKAYKKGRLFAKKYLKSHEKEKCELSNTAE